MSKLFILFIYLFTSIAAQTVSEKFDAGMKAYNTSQFIEANRLFDTFLKEQTSYDELYATATFYSSMSLMKMGNPDAAAVGFDYLVRNFIWSNFRDHALYELGIIYYDHNNFSLSRGYLIKLLGEYPESDYSGSALYWVGESYTKENKLEDAINFFLQAIQDKRNNKFIDYTIYSLASVYEKIEDFESAVKYYDELISFHTESSLVPAARIRLGMCYFKLKDYQSSILELNNPSLSSLSEDMYSENLYYLANSYYRAQEYANAEKTYKEILLKFPGVTITREVKYGLAWSYFQQKKYNDAYKLFNSVSEGSDTLVAKSFYWKGESKRYAGQEADALDIYQAFIEKYPNNKLAAGAQYQLGVLYFNSRKFDLSKKYLESSLISYDNSVKDRGYTMLGEISLQEKNYPDARDYFNKALNITNVPVDLQNRSLLGLGVAYYFLKNYKEAISNLSEIDIRDQSFEKNKLNFYMAENLYAAGQYEKAVVRYDNVDPADKDFGSQAMYGKAYALFNLKQFEHAAEIFSGFTKRYPGNDKITDVKLRLADCYYGSKNYSAAASVYKDIFKSDNTVFDNPFNYFQYAQALFKGGKNTEAINEFRNLQQKYPQSEYADKSLYVIAWITFQQNNYKGAIASYRNITSLYPATSLRPLIYYSVGDCYYNLGLYDSAVVNYQNVLEEFPSSNYVFDAVNGIQYCFVAQGKPERPYS
jgi:tetratricopeptide (TPR) repeat protein